MTVYRERLWPAPWLFLGTALVIPASLLVFLPINQFVGAVVAVVLYLGCVVLLLNASPLVQVTDSRLRAGKASIPLSLLGSVEHYRGEEARQERAPRLDARAYLCIRGWVDPVLRVEVTDPEDPTPYWLLSTRRPEKLAEAIAEARLRTPGR